MYNQFFTIKPRISEKNGGSKIVHLIVSLFLKKCDGMTSPSLYTILSTWTLARNFVLATIGTSSKANYQSFFRLILASTVKICSSEKNLIRSDTFFKEHNSRLQRATRSWQHQICPIFNVYDLYRKSSSAIRRTVASLTPQSMLIFATIALGYPKSRLSFFNCESPCGAFFRVTLPRWHIGTFVGLF